MNAVVQDTLNDSEAVKSTQQASVTIFYLACVFAEYYFFFVREAVSGQAKTKAKHMTSGMMSGAQSSLLVGH